MEELKDILYWMPIISASAIVGYVVGYYSSKRLEARKRKLEKKRERGDNLDSGYYLDEEPDFEESHRRYDEDSKKIVEMLGGVE